jgi:type IV secretory pathway VirD2 relaxase
MTNSIVEKDKVTEHDQEWLKTNEEKEAERRLAFLKTFVKPNSNVCPECYGVLSTTIDEDETLCEDCGLIVSMSIEYVAGQKIDLPHGRH